jgi:tripartite-type tricarboxylate transporter receptor subunit TctC
VIKFVSSSHFCRLIVGAVAIASVASLTTMHNFAFAQTARTIRLVVPYAPGGVTDAMMRMFAEQIGRTQGRSAVVENHPGAGTVIATEAVSHAAPMGTQFCLYQIPSSSMHTFGNCPTIRSVLSQSAIWWSHPPSMPSTPVLATAP